MGKIWQFPRNEAGKVLGWSDDSSPSNPNAALALVNRSLSEGPVDFRTYATLAEAAGSNIPPVIDEVEILNYATAGDGGGGRYVRALSEPSHAGKFQSANGVWWELVATMVNPYQFGAAGDGVTDDYLPLDRMFEYAGGGRASVWITSGDFACIAGSPTVRGDTNVYGIAGGTVRQKTLPNTNPLSASDPGDGEFSGLHINRASENIVIDGVRIRGPYGDLVAGEGALCRVVVSNGGSGYLSAPTVVISGGGGTGATATANLTGGVVTSVTVTAGGSGYTGRPTIAFTGGSGTGATAYSVMQETRYRSIGIAISGRYDQYYYENPNYPSNPSDPLSNFSRNIFIRNCDIEGFGQSGILADHIRNFEAINNRISRCGRDGIRMYGVQRFKIIGNDVIEMAPGFLGEGLYPNNNVYGIAATRIYHSTGADGSLTDYPKSEDGVIALNTVRNCWSWKSIDTHGGTDIVFANNIIRNSHIGIGIDKGGFNLADGYAPPRRLTVVGNNIIHDRVSGVGARAGISVFAHEATDVNFGEDITIADNYVEGYGEDTRDGGIVVSFWRRVVIEGNILVRNYRAAINFQNTVEDFNISGGVIADTLAASSTTCIAVMCQAPNQRGMIDGVVFRKTNDADVMTAISVASAATGYGVTVGDNLKFHGTVTKFNSSGAYLAPDSQYMLRKLAWANVNNNGSTALVVASKGNISVARTGVGVVRVTVPDAMLTSTTFEVHLTARGTVGGQITWNPVSTTEFDVYTFNAGGTAADTAFTVSLSGY